MIRTVPRRGRGGGRRRPLAAAAVLVALAGTSLIGSGPAAGAPDRVAATGGCRAVGSGEVPSGGGPNRATVVVDTGSGPVWSACISFSGSISGVEALERAEAVITDLDPVYDQYTGLGKAICKLRGVGSPPPDCLGKSINYWSLSRNGKVSGVGAAGLTINDGDVEGWRYGTGGTPRPATEGTEAAAAPPPTTTTKPPTPTTQPPAATTAPKGGGSGLTGATTPDGKPVASTTTKPGETTTTVKGQTTTTAKGATTTTEADGHTTQLAGEGDDDEADGDGASGGGSTESASGTASSQSTSVDDDGAGGSSSLPAILGFVAVIAAIGGGVFFVRRRNAATPTA